MTGHSGLSKRSRRQKGGRRVRCGVRKHLRTTEVDDAAQGRPIGELRAQRTRPPRGHPSRRNHQADLPDWPDPLEGSLEKRSVEVPLPERSRGEASAQPVSEFIVILAKPDRAEVGGVADDRINLVHGAGIEKRFDAADLCPGNVGTGDFAKVGVALEPERTARTNLLQLRATKLQTTPNEPSRSIEKAPVATCRIQHSQARDRAGPASGQERLESELDDQFDQGLGREESPLVAPGVAGQFLVGAAGMRRLLAG